MDCCTKENQDYGFLNQRGLRLWIVNPKRIKHMYCWTKEDKDYGFINQIELRLWTVKPNSIKI